MRRLFLFVGLSLLGACGVFGSGDSSAPTTDPADAGTDGNPAIVGDPVGDYAFTIDPLPSTFPVIQGATTKVRLTIKRGKALTEPVVITTRGLRDGITSAPLSLAGDTGDLELSVPAIAPQGEADGVVEASAHGVTIATPLKTFVRGKPGDIDTTYGSQGVSGDLFGRNADEIVSIVSVVVAPDDSVYVVGMCDIAAGDASFACVVHVGADGKRDATYGVAMPPTAFPRAAALQPDGKLVVVGGGLGPGAVWGTEVTRLDAAGQKDFTIGPGGARELTVGGLVGSESWGAYRVAVRDDGDIFVAFDDRDPAISGVTKNGVARLAPDGTFRTAFGSSGTSRWDSGQTTGLLVRNNPKSPSKGNLAMVWVTTTLPLTVKALQVNGTTGATDPLFAPSPVALDAYRPTSGPGLVELADGSIVALVGSYLRKFGPDGKAAAAFGLSGTAGPFASALPSGISSGMALQADEKILVAFEHPGGLEAVRFLPSGVIDAAFGQNGHATKALGLGTEGRQVVVQKSGRILMSADVSFAASRIDGALVAYWP
jgi:hypothetical protein